MRRNTIIWGVLVIIIIVLLVLFAFRSQSTTYNPPAPTQEASNPMPINPQDDPNAFSIASPAFAPNTEIPQKYACDGQDISPELHIKGVGANVKSLALIVEDPDAPNGTFIHWVAWNIPATTTMVAEGTEPQGVGGKNGAGKVGYMGPCPPSGTHHYHFDLYGLDSMLSLPAGSTKAELDTAMLTHVIQQTELIGLYTSGKQ